MPVGQKSRSLATLGMTKCSRHGPHPSGETELWNLCMMKWRHRRREIPHFADSVRNDGGTYAPHCGTTLGKTSELCVAHFADSVRNDGGTYAPHCGTTLGKNV